MSKELKIISPIIKKVEELSITTGEDMNPATEMLSQANKVLDKLIEEKEKLTKPLNATLKEIRSRYKPMEDMLEQAITSIKSKMSIFQMAQLKAQREEEAKIAAKVESGYIKMETAVKKMSEVGAPDAKVKTESGSVGFTTVKKFEVVDIVMLANANSNAILPNEVYIRTQMKAGIELSGVRYFEELSVRNNR